MKNIMLDLIHAHGSVRDYKPDPVPVPIIEIIIAAAQRSSTSSNLQAYSVVATTDPATRQRLAELCGNQRHVAEAPLFLTWCADLARLGLACKLHGYTQVTGYVENFLVAAVDAAIASQTAALAAESLDLGICYIGSIRNNPQQVVELLGLPPLVFPITGMTVGYPLQPPPKKPRLPLNAILHWEKYSLQQKEPLREYDRVMSASGIYRDRQVPATGRETPARKYGWTEHSARRVSQAARTGLRGVVEAQGFGLK